MHNLSNVSSRGQQNPNDQIDPRDVAMIHSHYGVDETAYLGSLDPDAYRLLPNHGLSQAHIDREYTFLVPAPDYSYAFISKWTPKEVPDERSLALDISCHEVAVINQEIKIPTTQDLLRWDLQDWLWMRADRMMSQEVSKTYFQFLPEEDRDVLELSYNQMLRLQNWVFSEQGNLWFGTSSFH